MQWLFRHKTGLKEYPPATPIDRSAIREVILDIVDAGPRESIDTLELQSSARLRSMKQLNREIIYAPTLRRLQILIQSTLLRLIAIV